jgi:carbamoyl-phosphate synthase small subunit
VRRTLDGTVQITAQNHGFAVDTGRPLGEGFDSGFGPVEITHINLNDQTVEGMDCLDIDAFSVQYHPEAAPGPNDAKHLFDEFATKLTGGKP